MFLAVHCVLLEREKETRSSAGEVCSLAIGAVPTVLVPTVVPTMVVRVLPRGERRELVPVPGNSRTAKISRGVSAIEYPSSRVM